MSNGFAHKFTILAAIAAVTAAALAQGTSPIGSLTTPQSSGGSGLVPSRTPGIYTQSGGISGNDIVTGNVTGGREFRGVVPYGSPAYFQGSTGTGSVDSFLRRSAGSGYVNDRAPGRIQQYYDPQRTVTSLQNNRPSNSQVYQALPNVNKSGANTYGLVPLEEAQQLAAQNRPLTSSELTYSRYRPLTATPQEMQLMLSDQLQGKLPPLPDQQNIQQQAQDQQIQQEQQLFLKNQAQIKEQAQQLKITAQPLEPERMIEPQQPLEPGQLPQPKMVKVPTVFDEMKKRSRQEFQKNMAEIAKKQAEGAPSPEANEVVPGARGNWSLLESGMAKSILGISNTFAKQSNDSFNTLMKAGENYLKNKQFYKAADAYTLATTYQSENPLPYGGKSLALFGAGEYMSSAYFLARAVEIYPDYVRFKIDMVSMLGGDKDLIESRVKEIRDWQERSGSGELLMLLSYVYFETGQLDQAQMAKNGAMVKMPESKALKAIGAVIDKAVAEAKAGK